MDTSSIAGAALLMKTGQTQQSLSVSIMKQAADQQKMMANLLEQSARQVPQPAAQSGYGFSVLA
jgi:hypothetical protein